MNTKHRVRLSLEFLDSRLAPASASVTYTDIDGDLVKISATVPGSTAPPLDSFDLAFTTGLGAGQLASLTLTQPGFDGAKVVFAVLKKPGGDGLAHVGFINASGVDLDRVVVKGDLGKIVAGDSTTTDDPGLNLLQARTMGMLGLTTQSGAGDLNSTITGKLGALKVAGDVTDASLTTDFRIGSVFIGGDLTGGAASSSGNVLAFGMGNVFIGGDVVGGSGANSGSVYGSGGGLGRLFVGGSVVGGAGPQSGGVKCGGPMGEVRIGSNLIGGAGVESGFVTSATTGIVRIGGTVAGGSGNSSGVIDCSAIGLVRIGGNLIGGSVTGANSLANSGVLRAGRIASVTIGGSLIAGSDASTGTLSHSGAIIVNRDLGPVKIGGSILGNSTNPALITASGHLVKPTTGFDVAIASLRVGGDVRFARILAGFNFDQIPANADASIGSITVGGDWVASNLVAGAQDAGTPGYGVGDTLQTTGDTALVARIASITIKGDATGSLLPGDHFGFVAEEIGQLKIGSRTFSLGTGKDNLAIPFADDVRLLEVN